MKFYTRFNTPPKVVLSCPEPTLTQQHFAEDANINTIMAKYHATGYLTDPTLKVSRQPLFDDFTSAPDYVQSQCVIAEANQLFAQLPSLIRKRFNNEPVELLAFLAKEENIDEARRLGLVTPLPLPVVSDRTIVPPPA